MFRDALLAAGVILATFTRLRVGGDPLGLGEVLLLAWMFLTLCRSMQDLNTPFSPAFIKLAIFWIIVAASMCAGTMTAYVVGERNSSSSFIHDIMAYTLVATVSLLALAQTDAALRLRSAAWCVVVFGSACLAVQLAEAFGMITISAFDIWFYDRLTGWTTNANQLGLLCLILALLSFHLAETATAMGEKAGALVCAILPLWAGYLTRSDAFLITMLLSVPGFAGLKLLRLVQARHGKVAGPAAAPLFAVVAGLALLAGLSPLAYVLAIEKQSEQAGTSQRESGLERDVGYRTELLGQAIERGLASGMLGLGPGPHLTRPANLREPQMDALPNFEAHNMLADLFLQGGILAVAGLLWLGATTILAALKAKLNFMPILLISISVFGLTHFIMRHPIIWFVIALGLATQSLATQSLQHQDSGLAGRMRRSRAPSG